MTVNTAAGSKIFIGPQATSSVDTIGEYQALSYTEIGEVEDLGEFGDQANPVTFTALADGRVRKLKGSMDAGSIAATLGFDGADAGQLLIAPALASKKDYAFKVILNDGADGSPSQDTTFFFRGKVMSKTTNVGSVDNVVRSSVNIGINSEILQKSVA